MLSEQQYAEITMMMRVVNLANENPEIVASQPEFARHMDELKAAVAAIWEQLDDGDHDRLLEQYDRELDVLGLRKKQ